jgi:hypothetical protein
MKATPNLVVTVEFYDDSVETLIDRPGLRSVDPALVSGFLRGLAESIDEPDMQEIAKYIRGENE